jgi:hypothetical protein
VTLYDGTRHDIEIKAAGWIQATYQALDLADSKSMTLLAVQEEK